MAMPLGDIPPPEPAQAVSHAQAPPAPAVASSVAPTATTFAESAGQESFPADHAPPSPEAAKKFCPCASTFGKKTSAALGSAGVQPPEQPICRASGASVVTVMALRIAVSVEPTY